MNSRKEIEKVRKTLEKQHYGLVGDTSAVQICRWTKNSLKGEGGCWKEKFYGISSAGCCQFSPAVMWCENKCLHCWRPIEMNLGTELPCVNDPKKIIDGIVEKRKKLLEGFGGLDKVDKEKYKKALTPSLFTFSLSGEATLYPRLGEMINEIRRRGAVSFLVTNGQNPEMISKLAKEKNLPTQLTISTNAPNEKLFSVWHNSCKKNAWGKFNETLELMKKLKGKVRRVVRLTLVKEGKEKSKWKELTNMTDENVFEYVDLIEKANPDFVHVKGFMSVGYARERLGYDKQPWHKDVREFAGKIVQVLNRRRGVNKKSWKILGEEERSCVVLIGRDEKMLKIERA